MTDYKVDVTKENMTSPSSHQRSVSRYQLNGKIHPIILYRWMARERERDTFLDESISPIVDPLGEESGELLSDDSPILCVHCYTSNSGFRIGSKWLKALSILIPCAK